MPIQIVIGGIPAGPAGIAGTRSDYSAVAPEPGVRAPESTQGEGCSFKFSRGGGVDGGNQNPGTIHKQTILQTILI